MIFLIKKPRKAGPFDHLVELVGFEPTSKHGMDKLSTRLVLLGFSRKGKAKHYPIFSLVCYLNLQSRHLQKQPDVIMLQRILSGGEFKKQHSAKSIDQAASAQLEVLPLTSLMSVFKEADPSSLYVLTYAMLMLSKPVSPHVYNELKFVLNTNLQMQSYEITASIRDLNRL